MSKRRLTLLLMGLMWSHTGWGGEMGQVAAATDLKAEPFIDAQTVAPLPASTQIEVLRRQGGWLRVKASGGEGWVRMIAVRLAGSSAAASGSAGVKELVSIAQTGRSGTSGTTVATGVRGLSADDLKNPVPDPAAVRKLDSFVVSKAEAESFAHREHLERHTIEYLQPGGSSASSSGASSSGGTSVFGGAGR